MCRQVRLVAAFNGVCKAEFTEILLGGKLAAVGGGQSRVSELRQSHGSSQLLGSVHAGVRMRSWRAQHGQSDSWHRASTGGR